MLGRLGCVTRHARSSGRRIPCLVTSLSPTASRAAIETACWRRARQARFKVQAKKPERKRISDALCGKRTDRQRRFVSRVAYAYADNALPILSQGLTNAPLDYTGFLLTLDAVRETSASMQSQAAAHHSRFPRARKIKRLKWSCGINNGCNFRLRCSQP